MASSLAIVLTAQCVSAAEPAAPLDLWSGQPPLENGEIGPEKSELRPGPPAVTLVTNVTQPTLTIYRPEKGKDSGAMVVINPGGGYSVLAWDLEGEEVARWLNSIGVSAAILKYRVPARAGQAKHLAPLADAQRAVRLLRSKATELGIDPQRIGILGFSAGGNLAAIACSQYDQQVYKPADDVDALSARPDFAILIYPAWLAPEGKNELSPEITVNDRTPPMFLAHAHDDPIKDSSIGCAVMYIALKRANVPAELHIFVDGGHGYGLRPAASRSSTWPERCADWLRNRKIISAEKG